MLPNNCLAVITWNAEAITQTNKLLKVGAIFITLIFWKVAFRDDDTDNQGGVFYKVLVGCSIGNSLNNNNNSYSKLKKLIGSHFSYSKV
jgi:hypothetical protein